MDRDWFKATGWSVEIWLIGGGCRLVCVGSWWWRDNNGCRWWWAWFKGHIRLSSTIVRLEPFSLSLYQDRDQTSQVHFSCTQTADAFRLPSW